MMFHILGDNSYRNHFSPKRFGIAAYIPNDALYPGGTVVLKVVELKGIAALYGGEFFPEKRQNSGMCATIISCEEALVPAHILSNLVNALPLLQRTKCGLK